VFYTTLVESDAHNTAVSICEFITTWWELLNIPNTFCRCKKEVHVIKSDYSWKKPIFIEKAELS